MSSLASQNEILPDELSTLLLSEAAPFLLDVREPNEFALCKIYSAVLIPLPQVALRISELPRDREIVVYCHSGRRSADATAYLLEQGFSDVKNLVGGILRWGKDIDPSMKLY